MKTKATLVNVIGDRAEFSDMIGGFGELIITKDGGSFNCLGNEWLEFRRKRVSRKGTLIRVKTQLDNTFVFDTRTMNNFYNQDLATAQI